MLKVLLPPRRVCLFKVRNKTSYTVIREYQNSGILGTNRVVRKSGDKTSIAVTDPYVIYKYLVKTKEIDSDPFQLALIKKLRLLSGELQTYKPDLTTIKINKMVRELEVRYNQQQADKKGVFFGYTIEWLKEHQNDKMRTNVIKVLNDFEELALLVDVPKGLLINGEVGCGKTMIMDLFADSLPVEGKWRVHWGVFIQWVMNEIENISKRKLNKFTQVNHSLLNYENEFMLFEIASRLIERSHVLILDEFMLPDIASAKIINILFVYYFKLGGVLVASSNRLPEELYSGSINKTTMGDFEKILRCRCDVWDMQSKVDYRRELKDEDISPEKWLVLENEPNSSRKWNELISRHIKLDDCLVDYTPFKSYGRDVIIPKCNETVAYFQFKDLVEDSKYGPSDFISISNKYPTIIIDHVPILSIREKNYARQLITFIDAIYDSKCNLIMRSEDEPNRLFFPDLRSDNGPTRFKCTPLEDQVDLKSNTQEMQDLEMFSKTEMDLVNPYRPNFATYEKDNENYQIEKGNELLNKSFTDMKKFTGEDEMFAYKRAVSRINEMTQSIRWRKREWTPLHDSFKLWENGKNNEKIERSSSHIGRQTDESIEKPVEPPRIKEYNFWSMGKWNNKATHVKDEVAKKWIQGSDLYKK